MSPKKILFALNMYKLVNYEMSVGKSFIFLFQPAISGFLEFLFILQIVSLLSKQIIIITIMNIHIHILETSYIYLLYCTSAYILLYFLFHLEFEQHSKYGFTFHLILEIYKKLL